MNKLLQHRSLIRENIVLLIGISLCFYFAYHAIAGNRSVIRLLTLERSIARIGAEYETTHAERVALETKVKAMRPGSLSKDLLEERAKAVLGYRHPNEVEMNLP